MIIPMKKASLVVLKQDHEALLKSLQRYGDFMIIGNEESKKSGDTLDDTTTLAKTEKSLKILKNYAEKKKLLDFTVVAYEELTSPKPKQQEMVAEIEKLDDHIRQLKEQKDSILNEVRALKPWQECDEILSTLTNTKYTRVHVGYSNPRTQIMLEEQIKQYSSYYQFYETVAEGIATLIVNLDEEDIQVMDFIKNNGFSECTLPMVPSTMRDYLASLEQKVAEIEQQITSCEKQLTELGKSQKEIEIFSDQIVNTLALKNTEHIETLETIYLEGWVRSDKVDRFEKTVASVTEFYDISLADPTEEEMPPTYTKNNEFVAPFESVTDMFSRPNPYEVDPNPVMSFWYWIIFGIMMGDAGYGVVMFIGCFLFLRFKRPRGTVLKITKMFLYSSVTTLIWGILFGSYFGFTWNPILLEPAADILDMLILSLVLGGLHVLSGMAIKLYSYLKKGQYLDALLDVVSWMLVLIGIGLLFVPQLSQVGTIMALIGSATIVIFGGRNKSNLFGKLTGGLTSLYGISSYLSDILSYSRILALSLSTGIIAFVMNLLAGLMQGSIVGIILSVFVYLIGHTFNIVMGLLSAYVHDGRLQYIEFFGKFYEGGGYEFTPLELKLKYVHELENEGKAKGEL